MKWDTTPRCKHWCKIMCNNDLHIVVLCNCANFSCKLCVVCIMAWPCVLACGQSSTCILFFCIWINPALYPFYLSIHTHAHTHTRDMFAQYCAKVFFLIPHLSALSSEFKFWFQTFVFQKTINHYKNMFVWQ